MGSDESMSSLFSKLDRIIELLEMQNGVKKRTVVTDNLAGQAVVLMTRPENRTSNGGKVIRSRIAKALGMDVRTLNNMPEVQQAIQAIEGD